MKIHQHQIIFSILHNGTGRAIPIQHDSELALMYVRAKEVFPEVDFSTHIFLVLMEDATSSVYEFPLIDDTDVASIYKIACANYKNVLQVLIRKRGEAGSSSSVQQKKQSKRVVVDDDDDKLLESSCDSNWIAGLMKKKLKDEPNYSPVNMCKDIHREHGLQVKYKKAWRGKEIAMAAIHGETEESYDRLRWYCRVVKKYNPGSVAEYETEFDDPDNKFKRVFISLAPCIQGFVRGCRPLVFLDGTHIKNKYKGILLTAVGKDANEGLLTIAYAVVDAANDDYWEWFCDMLRAVFRDNTGLISYRGWTFFTDRHASLLRALNLSFPDANHSYCLRHLVANFLEDVMKPNWKLKSKYWSDEFKRSAYAATLPEHQRRVNKIKDAMAEFDQFYNNSQPESWANAMFQGNRWGIINNQAESCNKWVLEAQHLPIVSMLQLIYGKIMVMMSDRRLEGDGMTELICSKAEEKLSARHRESRNMVLRMAGRETYEVTDPIENVTYAVDVPARTCSCRLWQIERIPCSHACACIESSGGDLKEYVDQYFRCEKYRIAYEKTFALIPTFEDVISESDDDDDDEKINPPNTRVPPGRPRTQRRPSQVEKKVKKCSRCRLPNHDRRLCKKPI